MSDAQVGTPWTAAEIPVLAARLLTKEEPANVARELPATRGQRIFNAAVSRRGLLIVVSGEAGDVRDGDDDPRVKPKFITVFDARSRECLRRRQLFTDEQSVDTTTWFGRVKYSDGTLHHIAYQLTISPDEELVAFSYERYSAASPLMPGLRRTEPKFAIYQVDSLTHVGTVSHPKRTITDEGWASISPQAGGKLLFSRDGRQLYTTTSETRLWRIVST